MKLKCTIFDFGWGSATDPARGAYSAPPNPIVGFQGPNSKGKGGKEGIRHGRGVGAYFKGRRWENEGNEKMERRENWRMGEGKY